MIKNNIKILLLLIAFTSVAHAQNTPFSISADSLEYVGTAGDVKAEGDVEIAAEAGKVYSDNINYNKKSGKINLNGDVALITPDNTVMFMDSAEFDDSLTTGQMNNLRARLGFNGPAFIASTASKASSATYVMENAVYTPCATCGDEYKKREGMTEIPHDTNLNASTNVPWKIRAKQITYNKEEKKVKYKHAVLELYDVPVFYSPYLRHRIGDKTAESGFLTPKFASSSNRGLETTISYYQSVDPSRDYTFRSRVMSKKGTQFMAENRVNTAHFEGEFKGSILDDDDAGRVRNHLEGSGEYVFKKGTRAGVNILTTSDDDYLDQFFERKDSYAATTLYAENASDDMYFGVYGTFYDDLRSEYDDAQTSQVLPSVDFEKTLVTDNEGGMLSFGANVLSLYRKEGGKYQRLITSAEYSKPWILAGGNKVEASANVRADIYHTDDYTTVDNGFNSRVLPQASIMWERPLTSQTGYHTITPKAMLVVAENGDSSDDIPNENSVAYELDVSNLFSTNRFAGYVRIESGIRAIYGVENYWGNIHDSEYRLFVGQSFRRSDDDQLPALGGTTTNASDWVTYLKMTPKKWISLTNSARIDNSAFKAKRLDTAITLGDITGSYLSVAHTFLEGGPEEISARGMYELNQKWGITTAYQRDLTGDEKTLLSEIGAVYKHECYEFSFLIRRRGFTDNDIQPSTDYLFNIELLSLGSSK